MKRLILLAALLAFASPLAAQTATVAFAYPATTPAATVQGYIATLYVNGTPFVLNDTCVLTTTVTPNANTCTATLPNIAATLTVSGPQNFEVSLTDVILEGLKSAPPFVLTRPSAVSSLRIQ